MKPIVSVWVNREMPTGRWYRSLYCKSRRDKVKFWLIGLLLKSLDKSKSVCQTRLDTS